MEKTEHKHGVVRPVAAEESGHSDRGGIVVILCPGNPINNNSVNHSNLKKYLLKGRVIPI